MKSKSFITQIIIGFILLILVDCTQFDINLRKEKYSVLNSVINVVGYGRQVVKTVRQVW